ncbi:DUF192 domain-containing protein [Candidatus Saccharibacteria bacterium]|nr:DUF192 domain-containing protein [Candidatus Saccharibacteria bacterium]
MQTSDTKKIKSAPRNKYLLLILVGFILLFSSVLLLKVNNKQTIYIDNNKFSAEIVATDKERQKGLSGRESLAWKHAMVFNFEQEDYWNIWMKDMKFPIDVLWVNKDGKIISIEKTYNLHLIRRHLVQTKNHLQLLNCHRAR